MRKKENRHPALVCVSLCDDVHILESFGWIVLRRGSYRRSKHRVNCDTGELDHRQRVGESDHHLFRKLKMHRLGRNCNACAEYDFFLKK